MHNNQRNQDKKEQSCLDLVKNNINKKDCFGMSNVEAKGRITENCLGLWNESQMNSYRNIVRFCNSQGAKVGIQIAHAGRKSEIENNDSVAPSALKFSDKYNIPRELSIDEIKSIIEKFGESALLAAKAGFDMIEIHGAHGYLIHQFLSPHSNKRKDEYRDYKKFALDVIKSIKSNIPNQMPLIMRISATEYSDNGYNSDDMIQYIPEFIDAGVDGFDVSSGGNDPNKPEVFPAYQIQLAHQIKKRFNTIVIGVGRLETPLLAESIISHGLVDMIAIGRGLLKTPYWAKEAAEELNIKIKLPGVYDMGHEI